MEELWGITPARNPQAAESYGKYNSRIALPETVSAENVMAKVKDGVLYITITKARATGKRVVIDVQ